MSDTMNLAAAILQLQSEMESQGLRAVLKIEMPHEDLQAVQYRAERDFSMVPALHDVRNMILAGAYLIRNDEVKDSFKQRSDALDRVEHDPRSIWVS